MSTAVVRPRLWWAVARSGFRQHATYRAATAAGLFTNSVFGLLRAAVMLAVIDASASESIAGYGKDDATTYVWLGQGMIAIIAIWGWNDIALRIPTGEIASDLLRPADFQLWWFARDLGRAGFQLLTRGVPAVLIGAAVTGIVAPAASRLAPLATSVVLAVTISFGLRFIANLLVFWTLEWRGINIATNLLMSLCSGLEMPLGFYPAWAAATLRWLPWYGVIQAPLDIYLARRNVVPILIGQLAWAAVMLAAGRVVLARATRRLIVQGG